MGGVIYMKEKIIAFVKKETVLVVAAILAVISAFFVHPDQAYIDYIDFLRAWDPAFADDHYGGRAE